MLCSPPCGSGCSAAGRRQARFTGPRRGRFFFPLPCALRAGQARGTPKPHVMFPPFPPYGPAGGSGLLRSCPHPGNPSGGGTGYARKGSSLVLTSCRPAYGDGCLRPPVPKAKLWLEQAGSEQKCSARGTGGDSGVWKGASKGGNAPITGPFPPPGGHKGNIAERKGKNGKMPVNPATDREAGKARRR